MLEAMPTPNGATPAPTKPTTATSKALAPSRSALVPIAVMCSIAFIAFNGLFYVLSMNYFAAQRELIPGVGALPKYSAAQILHIRGAFAVFSGAVTLASFAGALRPRLTGHVIPVLLGAAYLVGAVAAFTKGAPGVVGVTLVVAGVFCPILALSSLRGSRAAWAFLVAICGVFAVVAFFAAPKIRGALDVGLWTTMILPGINIVAVASLISLRDRYLDRGVAAR